MNKSTRRRKLGAKKKDVKGILTVTAGVLLLVGIFGTYQYKLSTIKLTDKNTFCLTDSAPPSATIILLDATDSLSVIQKEVISIRIKHEISGPIPRYGALQLYTVGSIDDGLLKPHFSLCNPGDSSEIDPLWGNPKLVEKKWNDAFATKLDDVLSQLLKSDEADNSPIMEAMQSVSISTFFDAFKDSETKRLVIISDMVQNTSEFSQYKGQVSFDKFKKSAYFNEKKPHLKDVEVEIFYIPRRTSASIQGEKHISFWEKFIEESGGKLSGVIQVEG